MSRVSSCFCYQKAVYVSSQSPIPWRVSRLTKANSAHLKTRTRLYKCTKTGCNASFALRKDRTRHDNEQHGSIRWYCSFPGCTYQMARDGTARRANVERHVRTWHKKQDPTSYCERRT
ncbi:hypothetical protein DER44DRAFT_793742 [Fusarium oxysporum]|nr:hypothetical protein DER44DRAFT_793742 [Fusarium oxysporum]